MSIKFRRDGAVFPTEVTDGVLRIHVGTTVIEHPLQILKGLDFPYDNTWFDMSDIMGYFNNGEVIVVVRFDETATKLTQDYKVTGFCKFNPKEILDHLVYLPVGCVIDVSGGDRVALPCSIYNVLDSDAYLLECTNDPEPIVFIPNQNPIFSNEIMHGTRYFPSLIKTGPNRYEEDSGKYVVIGTPLRITGGVTI